jgi:large subunit ribosomal protein L13e
MVHFQGALTTSHLRKHWGRFVKTWFNQPARKRRRLENRKEKAAALYPRPVSKLRPVVQCNTIKYNKRARLGRGFTLAELKKAKIGPAFARGIGIAVDHRRQNKSVEAFQLNVQRLEQYRQRLVLFPRTDNKPKKGPINDADEKVLKELNVDQHGEKVLGVSHVHKRDKAAPLTKELLATKAYRTIKQEGSNQRNAGKREKKAKEAAEEKQKAN